MRGILEEVPFIKEKTAALVVELIKHEWPEKYVKNECNIF